MKKHRLALITFLIFLLFFSFGAFAQDTILKFDGEVIESEISIIDTDNIKYKKHNNLEGPTYIIKISDVEKIIFKNGTIETYSEVKQEKVLSIDDPKDVKKLSLDETKKYLVKAINEHGYEADSFKSRYRASFENNYLRLTELKKNKTEATKNSILYDFSNVYKIKEIDIRSDELAFLNIWVSILEDEENYEFDKDKLVIRIDDVKQAEAILDGLKHLNTLLVEEREQNGSDDEKMK